MCTLRFAHGIHHFPKQVLVRDVLTAANIAGALDDITAEALDFAAGDLAEIVIEGFARFDPLAVDQQGWRAWERIPVFVKITEKRRPFEGLARRYR